MEVILSAFVGFLVGGIFGVVAIAILVSKVINGNEDNDEL